MQFLFGSSSLNGSSDCVVITPTTKDVLARVAIDGKLMDEKWIVERSDQNPASVSLIRPGGLPVIAYDAFLKANTNIKNINSFKPSSQSR
jgi:hypothetical protein